MERTSDSSAAYDPVSMTFVAKSLRRVVSNDNQMVKGCNHATGAPLILVAQ
jgi:hypothetical protein